MKLMQMPGQNHLGHVFDSTLFARNDIQGQMYRDRIAKMHEAAAETRKASLKSALSGSLVQEQKPETPAKAVPKAAEKFEKPAEKQLRVIKREKAPAPTNNAPAKVEPEVSTRTPLSIVEVVDMTKAYAPTKKVHTFESAKAAKKFFAECDTPEMCLINVITYTREDCVDECGKPTGKTYIERKVKTWKTGDAQRSKLLVKNRETRTEVIASHGERVAQTVCHTKDYSGSKIWQKNHVTSRAVFSKGLAHPSGLR